MLPFVSCSSKSNRGQSGMFNWLDVSSHADIKVQFNTIGIRTAIQWAGNFEFFSWFCHEYLNFRWAGIMDWLYKLDSRFVWFNMFWLLYRSAWIKEGSAIFGWTTCCLLAIDLFWNHILSYFDCKIDQRFDGWWYSCHCDIICGRNSKRWHSRTIGVVCTLSSQCRHTDWLYFGHECWIWIRAAQNLIIPAIFGVLFLLLPNTPRYYLHKDKIHVRKNVLWHFWHFNRLFYLIKSNLESREIIKALQRTQRKE